MSTQQPSDQSFMVQHPLDPGTLVEGERIGERPRPDTPFRYVTVEFEDGSTWSLPEEELR